jgi:hypothetical protein
MDRLLAKVIEIVLGSPRYGIEGGLIISHALHNTHHRVLAS